MARKKKTREPKPKQGHLAGMEPPSIPEIDRAADAYCEIRDERMKESVEEKEKRILLKALLAKHGLSKYEYDGKIVELETTSKVKVRVSKKDDDDDQSGDDTE